ncbi:MAG: serine/threonine protein kinase [Planctomycetales bacterium]|nr:serine/threonine protein kinase [Planctomycetales bacterium]
MQIERLGPYRIEKQIGKGGMGAVYEATYEAAGEHHGMRVAIKALSPQLAAAEGFRERFESEIESLKKLRHAGIVQLYGYGEQDGVLFYSMELVEGTSLEEELRSGRRFDWRETIDFGIQICRALKHAHDHGVVHRDIKPANLLLARGDKIKVADFGIARLFGGTQLTTAGGVLGTADYMSPEQADGRIVSERCDQYSLGGVMYALLSGRPPFKARTMPEMLQLQRFAEPEPVKRYAPDTPNQVDQLVSQLLAKDPADRFPNVLVLARHMEALRKGLSRPVEDSQGTARPSVGSTPQRPATDATADMDEDATKAAVPLLFPNDGDTDEAMRDLFDAPTLAESDKQPSGAISAVEKSSPKVPLAPQRRFTTVDEETRREHEKSHGGRFWLVAQFASMVGLLGILVWGGWQLMQPTGADELYEQIVTRIDDRGLEDLRMVSSELEDFLTRFPEDTRAVEIQQYQQRLEFQRFERQARRKSRSGSAEGASPVESTYYAALSLAEHDPARALEILQSLLMLYDPTGQTAGGAQLQAAELDQEGDFVWLVLVRKQIEELRAKVQMQAERQVPLLRQRLAAAAELHQTHPAQANRMYRAIVYLYGSQPWAKDIVEEATRRLPEETRMSAGE